MSSSLACLVNKVQMRGRMHVTFLVCLADSALVQPSVLFSGTQPVVAAW